MFSTHTKTGRNNMVGYTVAKIRKQQLIISQRELADRLNSLGWDIDKNGIQRIESGERFVNDMELIYLVRHKREQQRLNALRSFNTRHG